MTELLQRIIAVLEKLPEAEQDANVIGWSYVSEMSW
jgi:hypothetical protein